MEIKRKEYISPRAKIYNRTVDVPFCTSGTGKNIPDYEVVSGDDLEWES